MKPVHLLFTLVLQSVRAIPNLPHQPKQTGHDTLDPLGWTPRPTEAPSPHIDLVRRGDLDARQLSFGQLVGYFAPDATCGFVAGKLGAPFTCASTARCAVVAPISGVPGEVGCCPTSGTGDCGWGGTCYDYDAFYTSSACDHACQQDTNVVLCTSTKYKFCYKYTLPDLSATAYACDSTSGTDTVLTTFTGDTQSNRFSTFYNTLSSSGASTPIRTPSLSPIFSTSGRSGASVSTSPTPSQTSAVPDEKKTPIGAIVGGVVGGVAVLAAIAGGIIYFILRSRKKNDTNVQQVQPHLVQQPPPMAAAGMAGMPPHDPRMSYFPPGQDVKPPMDHIQPPGSPSPTYMTTSPVHMAPPNNGLYPQDPIYYNGVQSQSPVYPQSPPPPPHQPGQPPQQPLPQHPGQQPPHQTHYEMPGN